MSKVGKSEETVDEWLPRARGGRDERELLKGLRLLLGVINIF